MFQWVVSRLIKVPTTARGSARREKKENDTERNKVGFNEFDISHILSHVITIYIYMEAETCTREVSGRADGMEGDTQKNGTRISCGEGTPPRSSETLHEKKTKRTRVTSPLSDSRGKGRAIEGPEGECLWNRHWRDRRRVSREREREETWHGEWSEEEEESILPLGRWDTTEQENDESTLFCKIICTRVQ